MDGIFHYNCTMYISFIPLAIVIYELQLVAFDWKNKIVLHWLAA